MFTERKHAEHNPEHEKLRRAAPKTQAAGEFVDWLLHTKRVHLAERDGQHCDAPLQDLLAEWTGIDRAAIENEKRAMLEALRKLNAAQATAQGWCMLRDYEQRLALFRASGGGGEGFPLMAARPPDAGAVAHLLAWVRAYADAATAEGLDASDTAANLSLELNLDSDDKYDGQQASALLKAAGRPCTLNLTDLLARAKRLEDALTDADLAGDSPALAEAQRAMAAYNEALEAGRRS